MRITATVYQTKDGNCHIEQWPSHHENHEPVRLSTVRINVDKLALLKQQTQSRMNEILYFFIP